MRIITYLTFFCCTFLLPIYSLLAQNFVMHRVAGGSLSSADGVLAMDAILNPGPYDVACDAVGNIYVVDSVTRIRKIDAATRVIRTVAGGSLLGSTGDGGPATAASINASGNICTDASGNIYFTDVNSRIRRVDVFTGTISTFAGTGVAGTSGDGGAATTATLYHPRTICAGPGNNIYVCTENGIRKIDAATGVINSIGGAATGLYGWGICADNAGYVYVSDYDTHTIKKINIATGAVTVIAGTGSVGYSGDGGPATTAQIGQPRGIRINNLTNRIYFIDALYYVIREVDLATGIIRTVVGNTLISSGPYEGVLGTCPSFIGTPGFSYLDIGPSGNLLFSVPDFGSGAIMSASPINFGSSHFDVSMEPQCSGVIFRASMDTFVAGHSVHSTFGDGTSGSYTFTATSSCPNGFVDIPHTYFAPGVYTVKHVFMHGTAAVDSVVQTYHNTQCRIIPVKFYYDANANCNKDGSEHFYCNPLSVAVDSAGIPIDTVSIASGMYYVATGSTGTIYKFTLLPGAVTAVCPALGIVYDTIGVGPALPHLIGVECSASAYYDLAIHSTSMSRPFHATTWVLINNSGCLPIGGNVKVSVSPKYSGVVSLFGPVSGVVPTLGPLLSWNTNDINSCSPGQMFRAELHPLTGMIPVSDTVLFDDSVLPIILDNDTSDNEVVIVDTVSGPYDPNIIHVDKHCFDNDTTLLIYTIHFENMGNDTAYNVHVMDTLSDRVDPNSVEMVATSDELFTYKYSDGPYNIIKFDFPNIKLLDSAWHGLNDGMFVYKIRTRPGMSTGTSFGQRVGIYFDDNEVVMTNTAYSVKGCPVTGVQSVEKGTYVSLYPNPATSELTIKTEQSAFSSFIITNAIGQQMMTGEVSAAKTVLSIKDLPAGVYNMTLNGVQGREVRKFVKW